MSAPAPLIESNVVGLRLILFNKAPDADTRLPFYFISASYGSFLITFLLLLPLRFCRSSFWLRSTSSLSALFLVLSLFCLSFACSCSSFVLAGSFILLWLFAVPVSWCMSFSSVARVAHDLCSSRRHDPHCQLSNVKPYTSMLSVAVIAVHPPFPPAHFKGTRHSGIFHIPERKVCGLQQVVDDENIFILNLSLPSNIEHHHPTELTLRISPQ